MRDIDGMPARMRQLIPVQFFSWLALFAMWLFTNPAVTQVHFHATDTTGRRLQRRRELGGRAVLGV